MTFSGTFNALAKSAPLLMLGTACLLVHVLNVEGGIPSSAQSSLTFFPEASCNSFKVLPSKFVCPMISRASNILVDMTSVIQYIGCNKVCIYPADQRLQTHFLHRPSLSVSIFECLLIVSCVYHLHVSLYGGLFLMLKSLGYSGLDRLVVLANQQRPQTRKRSKNRISHLFTLSEFGED
jgi:hypothetical protein